MIQIRFYGYDLSRAFRLMVETEFLSLMVETEFDAAPQTNLPMTVCLQAVKPLVRCRGLKNLQGWTRFPKPC